MRALKGARFLDPARPPGSSFRAGTRPPTAGRAHRQEVPDPARLSPEPWKSDPIKLPLPSHPRHLPMFPAAWREDIACIP
jgi:hypothetical protein